MPPKRAGAGVAPLSAPAPAKTSRDDGAAIDVRLAEIDLKVDDLKAELEGRMDGAMAEMTKLVEAALLRLPARVRAMSMREFVGSFGGKASLVAEHERKEMRLARTVAKAHASAGGMPLAARPFGVAAGVGGTRDRLGTIVKPMGGVLARTGASADAAAAAEVAAGAARPAKLARIEGAVSVASDTVSSGAGATAQTKTPVAIRSRALLGGALPAATPSMATMKSAMGLHGAGSLAAATPSHFNPLLPKTPAGAIARRPRRGEVLYAVSANGSPIVADRPAAVATARGSILSRGPTASSALGGPAGAGKPSAAAAAAAAAGPGADVEIVLENGAIVSDVDAARRVAEEQGAAALLSTIEAMQAKLESLKAAATAAVASHVGGGKAAPPTASKAAVGRV